MPFPVFEKQTDIPKGFEDEYEEREGKWHPKDHDAAGRRAIEEEREARRKAEAATKAAQKSLKELEQRQQASAAGVTDEQLKKIREDARAEALAELEPKLKDADTLRAENRALKLDEKVKAALAAAKVLPERVDSLHRLHADEFDLTADGKPMVKGKPEVDVAKHVAGIVKQYPEWVAGTKAGGSGAQGGVKTPVASTPGDEVGKANPTQRLRAAHEAGATA